MSRGLSARFQCQPCAIFIPSMASCHCGAIAGAVHPYSCQRSKNLWHNKIIHQILWIIICMTWFVFLVVVRFFFKAYTNSPWRHTAANVIDHVWSMLNCDSLARIDLAQLLKRILFCSWPAMNQHPLLDDNGPVKGLPIKGIAREWECCEAIRDHLRLVDTCLFPKTLTETVKNACLPWVHGYLVPLLTLMAEHDGRPQPFVEPLREEILELYRYMGKQADEPQVIHDSWMTRKFLGMVKMKVRKEQPSTESWFKKKRTVCYARIV